MNNTHAIEDPIDRLDAELETQRDALYALARTVRPAIRNIVDRFRDDTRIELANGTTYRVARLSWDGRTGTGLKARNPNPARVLLRNDHALNNERRDFQYRDITHSICSGYYEGDRAIPLANADEIIAFLDEEQELIQCIVEVERQRTERIRSKMAQLQTPPP